MQTVKEAFLAMLKGEPADYYVDPVSSMKDVLFPGDRYIELGEKFDPHGTGPDAWGVLWTNQGPSPAFDGNTVAIGYKMFDDMDEWKEHVVFPDLEAMHAAETLKGMYDQMGVDHDRDVVSCLILSGAFERMNQLVGMENALCALYEYPDDVKEFFEAMCDYKLKCIEIAHETIHPHIIHMQDDWGTEKNMFFDPDIWREFIKPLEKRYAERIHELGMLYIHHSCGYIKQIIPDLVEIGVDGIEPMMINNDVPELLEKYGTQITMMGNVNNRAIETGECDPEKIRAEARRAMDACVGKGRFQPYYIPTNYERYLIFLDEVNTYGKTVMQR